MLPQRYSSFPSLVLPFLVAGCAPDPDAGGNSAPAPPPPNVIVILADDLGYGDIGANGSTVVSSPHIDELAANGVRLTDGYVSAAVCSPMRAGLFTGRYQNRFGYEYNPTANYERNADAELGLPEDETTPTFVHAERSRLLTLINFKTFLLLSKNQANTYLRLRAAFVYELVAVVVH